MAKYSPSTKPKTQAEKYWYNRGYELGLLDRTTEIQNNQARADKAWETIKLERARLEGVRSLAQALHNIADTAGLD